MNVTSERGKDLRFVSIMSAIAFAAVIAVNGLANALPLNGANTGVLSDEIPNLFVPAGLTFAIWGLIYLLLAGYVFAIIREAWGKRGLAGSPASPGASAWTGRDAALFLANMGANVAWIFAWHWRQVGLAMLIMLVILGTLIALELGSQRKLAPGGVLAKPAKAPNGIRDALAGAAAPSSPAASSAGPAAPSSPPAPSSLARRFFLTVPLRVYLGWISVATIANATAVLVKAGWNGFGLDPRLWTIVVIAAGLAVALGFSVAKKQYAAPLVVVWAYAGIVLKRTQVDAAYSAPVWIAAGLAALAILASFVFARAKKPAESR